MDIKVGNKKFTRKERRLENIEYKKYLYEKYKPTFSSSSLCFSFRGEQYQLNELLMKMHGIEQEKIYLDYYVTAFFIFLLCIGYWGVTTLDAYVLSVK